MQEELEALAGQVGQCLLQQSLLMTVAESCTGGWVAQAVTAVPGSSNWFDCGFVTYSNKSKVKLLGVSEQTLAQYGAVSEQTVIEMAKGAIQNSFADISVAISGIAGPTGGNVDRPVGTVWFAWLRKGCEPVTQCCVFNGDRSQVRLQAVQLALKQVAGLI